MTRRLLLKKRALRQVTIQYSIVGELHQLAQSNGNHGSCNKQTACDIGVT